MVLTRGPKRMRVVLFFSLELAVSTGCTPRELGLGSFSIGFPGGASATGSRKRVHGPPGQGARVKAMRPLAGPAEAGGY